MRAGLPHGRAVAGQRSGLGRPPRRPGAGGGLRLPYCGVGCHVGLRVRDGHIEEVVGRDGPSNRGRLCVKGRFGLELHRPSRTAAGAADPPAGGREGPGRLRRSGHGGGAQIPPRQLGGGAGSRRRWPARHPRPFRPARAGRLRQRQRLEPEAYLFQKLVRTGFGSNNVDHCTRLCHASSVAALLGSDRQRRRHRPLHRRRRGGGDLLIGARPDENHPVAASFLKDAARRGRC